MDGNPFSQGPGGFMPFGSDCAFCNDPRTKQFLFLVFIALGIYVLWQIIEQ